VRVTSTNHKYYAACKLGIIRIRYMAIAYDLQQRDN